MRNPLTALLLSLLLILTSVTIGAARGMAPVAGWVMLCAGGNATSVPVDSDGRPTRMHTCPDCTAAAVALLPTGPAQAQAPSRYQRTGPTIAAIGTPPAPHPAYPARGPPRWV